MADTSTKPYLLRAIHEWCTDNGYTPYIAVKVGAFAKVPMQYVREGQIVLDISYDATHGLDMNNTAIQFKARFGGVPQDIYIPVENVAAIYASENGQGMGFETSEPENMEEEPVSAKEPPKKPTLTRIK